MAMRGRRGQFENCWYTGNSDSENWRIREPRAEEDRNNNYRGRGQSRGQFRGQSRGRNQGQVRGQSSGQFRGQSGGQFRDQSGGQFRGQSGGQFRGQSRGSIRAYNGGQVRGLSGGPIPDTSGGHIGGQSRRQIMNGSGDVTQMPLYQPMITTVRSPTFRGFSPEFSEFYRRETLMDCKLISTDTLEYPIHRVVLARSCIFFEKLFFYHTDHVLDMTTYDSSCLEIFIQFAYTGTCEPNPENVCTILQLADEIQMIELINICTEYIKERIDTENCVGITQLTAQMSCFDFHRFCRTYTLGHFIEVVEGEEFYGLSLEELKLFLTNDWLNMSEVQAFHALKSWVEHKVRQRRRHIPELLRCIRFGRMEPFYLEAHVLTWRYMPRDMVHKEGDDFFGLRTLVPPARFDEYDLTAPWARPRIPQEFIFAIYGWGFICPTTTIEIYDYRADRWIVQKAPEITPRSYHFVTVVDNKIYMCGGFDGVKYLNLVVCYDPLTQTWEHKACMRHYRCYVTGCALDGKIYAIGGYNATEGRMSSVERYDVAKNQWEMIAHMNRKRSDASCCVLKGIIYVAGGFDGERTMRSVEYYNPALEPHADWLIISDMLSPRSGLTLAAYGNSIYAIGGNFGNMRLTRCERFTPTFPKRTNWVPIAQLSTPRSNASSVVLHGKIYVLGGYDSLLKRTSSLVEMYEPAYDCWTPTSCMNVRRSSVGACVITAPEYQYTYLASRNDNLSINDSPADPNRALPWPLQNNMGENEEETMNEENIFPRGEDNPNDDLGENA